MSLVKCKGWVNPSSLFFGPHIHGLTGYQSPAGSSTLISITGENFYSYSSISFGTLQPTVYFINSSILQFYVPNTLNAGSYPVQVFNGSIGSNIVTYTLDNASGYWLLNQTAGTITNTNTNSVNVGSLSRNLVSIAYSDSPYTVSKTDNWIVCNTSGGVIQITLPEGTEYNGRELMFKSVGTSSNIVQSTASIVMPINAIIDVSNESDVIIDSGERWVTMVYQYPYWIIMQSG